MTESIHGRRPGSVGESTLRAGDLFRQLREAADLSRSAIAKRAGLDPTGYKRIENNEQAPRMSTVVKLIGALGLDLSDERCVQLLEVAGHRSSPAQSARVNTVNNVIFEAALHDVEQAALTALKNIMELRTMWKQMNESKQQ